LARLADTARGHTVQDQLEAALSQFLARQTATICAGRTDAGVHALCQVVHVDTDAQRRPESWVRGLNTLLPPSISVQWAQPVADTFHARFSAQARTYIYVLRNARVRSPMTYGLAGWVHQPLDLFSMRQAAARLIGEHDFTSFRSSECQAASPVRHLRRLDIEQEGEHFYFIFTANAFLHHMVRNLMGVLVYVGMGRQPVAWADDVLVARDRCKAAPTFWPDGLYLAQVDYPEAFGLPELDAGRALESLTGISRLAGATGRY